MSNDRPARRSEQARALLRRPDALPVAILLAGLVGQLVVSLYWAHDGWLGVDGLHYISQRGGLSGEHTSVFAPYAGHWQPVLISIYLVSWWLFGLHSYLPYVLPAILAHLAICLLLYAVLRRLGVNPWVALVSSWLLLWYGTGGETWLADAPFALTSAVALGYAAIYVLVRHQGRRWAPWVACSLLVLSLGFSATSVVAIVLVASFALGVWGVTTALRVALLPAVVFATWYLVVGRSGGRVHVTAENLLDLPRNALSVLLLPLGDAVGVAAAGTLLTFGVLATVLLARVDPASLRALALAGVVAAVTQASLSVVANARLGPEAFSVGRYRYVILSLLVPAVALSLQAAVGRARQMPGPTRRVAGLLALLGVVAVTVTGIDAERSQASFTQAVADQYLMYQRGTNAATDLGERMLTPDVPRLYVEGRDHLRLAQPELRDELSLARASVVDRLQTENMMYVGVGPTTFEQPAPDGITSPSFDKRLNQRFGCSTYQANTSTPFITMTSFEGAQIAVTSASTTIRTRVVRDGIELEPRAWAVPSGQPIYIATSAQLAQLEIAFDAGGEFTICRA